MEPFTIKFLLLLLEFILVSNFNCISYLYLKTSKIQIIMISPSVLQTEFVGSRTRLTKQITVSLHPFTCKFRAKLKKKEPKIKVQKCSILVAK